SHLPSSLHFPSDRASTPDLYTLSLHDALPILLRRSYGDWRQNQQLMKDLAVAGFATLSTIRINNFSKNLADMQITVDTMDTLVEDRKSTRLNSSHVKISYAVFCLKKKTDTNDQ